MKKFICICFLVASTTLSYAQGGWYLNFSSGFDYVPPMPIIIRQQGYQPISFWAKYGTAPLKSPIYYSTRVGFKSKKKGWEAELNHLKIYMGNRPAEIQGFSVSHGYNQIFISRVKALKKFDIKTGAGLVIAHPENTIRNLKLDEKSGVFFGGYHISGIALKYGLARNLYISDRFYFMVEASTTAAYAIIPVVNGRAHVPVVAFHLQVGPGYYIIKKTGCQINGTLFFLRYISP
jgi:hypothetical protein